jgi:hypothetical protein
MYLDINVHGSATNLTTAITPRFQIMTAPAGGNNFTRMVDSLLTSTRITTGTSVNPDDIYIHIPDPPASIPVGPGQRITAGTRILPIMFMYSEGTNNINATTYFSGVGSIGFKFVD